MSLLRLCSQLRERPFDFVTAECAMSLTAFWAGYGLGNSAIVDLETRIRTPPCENGEMSLCRQIYLSSPDSKTGFLRVLDALERNIHIAGEPAAVDVRSGPPLLDAILRTIEQHRTGIFLIEPTSSCLYETLNGYWCGIASFDMSEVERQQRTMQRFESWLHKRYEPATARWYAILRVYGGPFSADMFGDSFIRFSKEESGDDLGKP